MKYSFPILLFLISILSGYGQTDVFPYDSETPVAIFNMPSILKEISGLSTVPDENLLVTIQDEEGDLFFIDKQSGKLTQQIPFGKDGDFEGVEAVRDLIYVVKSSGTLYIIKNAGKEDQEVDKYNGFLDKDYDVEGLAYDPGSNRLLLACKGKAGEGEDFDKKKAIYTYDIYAKELKKQPAYLFSLEAVQDYLDTSPAIRKLENLIEFFSPDKSKFTFSPSGLAIHPKDGNIYILSTAGRLIVVTDQEGKILHIEKLKKKFHPQPEGICFDKDATLYISNEGDGGVGRILKYSYSN